MIEIDRNMIEIDRNMVEIDRNSGRGQFGVVKE